MLLNLHLMTNMVIDNSSIMKNMSQFEQKEEAIICYWAHRLKLTTFAAHAIKKRVVPYSIISVYKMLTPTCVVFTEKKIVICLGCSFSTFHTVHLLFIFSYIYIYLVLFLHPTNFYLFHYFQFSSHVKTWKDHDMIPFILHSNKSLLKYSFKKYQ